MIYWWLLIFEFSKFYGFDSSDIDIVVQGSLSLKMIKNALSAYKDRFINLWILRAKVSLVKGTDWETYTDFDIWVNQNDGINGTLFINKIIKEFKEIKYIVIFLKVLLSVNNLNKTFDGGISSYGLILLVVSYFQQFKNKSKILDQNSKSNSGVLLSDHLINIFNLYGSEFNYKDVGISLRNGGFYYKRRDKNFDNSMSAKAFLSLENPVEPNVNVAKQAYRFERIKELFKSWIEKIKSWTEELSISVIRLILPTKNDQIKKYLFN